MDFSALNKNTSSTSNKSALQNINANGNSGAKGAQDTQDRFLKLLVAQMQNQDPMNPMDNAQVTTQLAQIQTVSGVGTLNTSIQALAGQFSQMQALQSVGLVGREVSVPGDQVIVKDGKAKLDYVLDSTAASVKLEVLSASGAVVDTVELGKQKAGAQSYSWDAAKANGLEGLKWRITATNGDAKVTSTTMMRDTVTALNTAGSTLQLELKYSGTVDYTKIRAIG